jgi:hypothetical protein
MRILNRVLGLASVLFLATALGGCGTDVSSKVMCSDASGCIKAAGNLFAGDASVDLLPQCCTGFCVMPSMGCESGFRYLTSTPGFGDCAAEPMCPAPPMPDLGMSQGDM